jgi:hypothetical protein
MSVPLLFFRDFCGMILRLKLRQHTFFPRQVEGIERLSRFSMARDGAGAGGYGAVAGTRGEMGLFVSILRTDPFSPFFLFSFSAGGVFAWVRIWFGNRPAFVGRGGGDPSAGWHLFFLENRSLRLRHCSL